MWFWHVPPSGHRLFFRADLNDIIKAFIQRLQGQKKKDQSELYSCSTQLNLLKASNLGIYSHLEARVRQILSERLNGARLVVFYQAEDCAVPLSVSTHYKLARFALVYHEMSTPIPASATGKQWSVKASGRLPQKSDKKD